MEGFRLSREQSELIGFGSSHQIHCTTYFLEPTIRFARKFLRFKGILRRLLIANAACISSLTIDGNSILSITNGSNE